MQNKYPNNSAPSYRPFYCSIIISIMLAAESKDPSSAQFDFQLTLNAIGSPLSKRHSQPLSRFSLEYTVSQISIENELEDRVPDLDDECVLPFLSLKDRECGYATASTRHTLASAVKSTFPTIRLRTRSCRQHNSMQKIRAVVAICPIEFDQNSSRQPISSKGGSTREKSRLRKSISVREGKNIENLPHLSNKFMTESLDMQLDKERIMRQAFKVKSICLQQNEARGKVYMKKLIQNRPSILHLSDTCQIGKSNKEYKHFRL